MKETLNYCRFATFEHGECQAAGLFSNLDQHSLSYHRVVQAVGYALVGGCAKPNESHQVLWTAGDTHDRRLQSAGLLFSLAYPFSHQHDVFLGLGTDQVTLATLV